MNAQQQAFLDCHNPRQTLEKALSDGIAASLQHNCLFGTYVGSENRQAVKWEWKAYLMSLVGRYADPQSVEQYESDILRLRDLMNLKFAEAFTPGSDQGFQTHPSFRLSHAQRSVAVFLKHLWCMGKVATPPQCPVGSSILEAAGRRYPATKWGYVNSIEEHRIKIGYLMMARQDATQPLAEWELRQFRYTTGARKTG